MKGVWQAARVLIETREKLQQSQAFVMADKAEYERAEAAYFKAWDEQEKTGDREPGAYPRPVLAGKLLILPADDWFDKKAGARLDYHTVEAMPEKLPADA